MVYQGVHNYKKPFHASFLSRSPYRNDLSLAPLGFVLVLWGISLVPLIPYWLSIVCFSLSIIVGIIGYWDIRSLFEPTWVNWLKYEHANVLPLLQNEIERIGYQTLNKRLQSQANLEAWVEEVRQKYGL